MRKPALYVLLPFVFAACPAGGQTPAQGVIEGEVRNALGGDPVPGARVKLFAPNTEARYARAASDGRFRFADISTGTYSVDADAPGFLKCGEPRREFIQVVLMPLRPREARPEARAACASVTESVEPDGMLRARMTISLTPYGVITGRITDPNGFAVADSPVEVLGVRAVAPDAARRPGVHLLPDGKNELIRITSVRTNDLGDFRAARLSPGAYYIVATKPRGWGRFPATYRDTYYPRSVDFASAKPLDVAAGKVIRADIRVADVAGVRVAGRLVNAPAPLDTGSGSPFYTNLVLLGSREYSLAGSPPFTMATGDSYEFKDVLPGSYKLLALTRDRAGDPWGYNHKPVLGASLHLEIANQDLDGIDLPLQPLLDMPGIVTFAEGCSPEPLRVIVNGFTSLAESRAEATPDSQGRFVLRGLTPATLTVRIEAVRSRLSPVVLSGRIGERDVLKDGFDYPAPPDEMLRITVGCSDRGRTQ